MPAATLTYQDAVGQLLRVGQELRGVKFDLANVSRLLEELGRPERAWKSVHIAGTNGKGSVAAMLDAVLRGAGYRTGLYTSPHLVRVTERIRVAGEEISETDFAAVFGDVSAAIERLLARGDLPNHPSFFECLTAMAFEHFRRAGIEIAVLETGMGGRLDATNVVTPLVSVITTIDYDHEAWLGNTLEQIAFEKAGIIKPGVTVVGAVQRLDAAEVIERVVRERNCELRIANCELSAGYRLALMGEHQRQNAAVVIAAVGELRRDGWTISEDALREGLATVRWPGRLEWIEGRPPLLLDGAHNPAGARGLRAYLECGRPVPWGRGRPARVEAEGLVLLFGALCDKAIGEIADLLFPLAHAVVITQPRQRRAASPKAIADVTRHLNKNIYLEPDSSAALVKARELAGDDGVVVVTGSLYLVGEIKQALS